MSNRSRIIIPLGDPAGIGTEVTLKALGSKDFPEDIKPLLVGCKKNIELVYKTLKYKNNTLIADLENLEIEDIPFHGDCIPGKPNAKTGEASFNWLTRATELILKGEGRALITAPIAKHAWHQANHIYAGQTERLGELSGTKNPSMLFTAVSPNNGSRLITLLATTHIPFKEVTKNLTPRKITFKLNTLLTFCQKFKVNPRLAIAGLNPHAGEQGRIGQEEIEWLIPTLNEWRSEHPNVILEGPIPPDTCWLSTAKAWQGESNTIYPDGILALYHDQGLIAVKLIAFDSAVNTTLGLSFIRTSPDHGTAFDIAGQGIAKSESMLAAIKTAWELSKTTNQA
tara:strand:+ start:2611 stop:3630 length:1020 start_codon:yes stop_codon:yes gene_type:complete